MKSGLCLSMLVKGTFLNGGWLKDKKRDQWMCHVQEWSWVRAAGFANVRRVEGDQELIMSLMVFSSFKATSHFPIRMSEASLPQWVEVFRLLFVERTWKW
jgi:hypothetical protein